MMPPGEDFLDFLLWVRFCPFLSPGATLLPPGSPVPLKREPPRGS